MADLLKPCCSTGVNDFGSDEWSVLQSFLPSGWKEQARESGAIQRRRGPLASPERLLRVLLMHVALDEDLRTTAFEVTRANIEKVSDTAVLKRFRTSAPWLRWISEHLCAELREPVEGDLGFRLRVLDSSTLQKPASRGTDWRLDYTIDLLTLENDWHEVTDAHGGERIERAPIQQGDVLIADRNFLRAPGVRAVREAGGYVLVRLRWTHPRLRIGQRTGHALTRARRLRVGEVGHWLASLIDERARMLVAGRLIALKLPAPLASRARRRSEREARKKGRRVAPRSLEAAQYVMLFTTVPEVVPAERILAWYRYRWQIELAFKRLKQLLLIGHVPHQDPDAARGWIAAKLVIALLLETLYRRGRDFSPWAYRVERLRGRAAEPQPLGSTRPPRVARGTLSSP